MRVKQYDEDLDLETTEVQSLKQKMGSGPLNTDAQQVIPAINEIKSALSDLATVDTGDSPSILNVNDTFQIPANVWKHNLIIVSARRQGLGNSTMFRKSDLASFDAGFNLMASNTESYRLKCSNTGVLTLISKTSGLNEPFITTTGIF